MMRATLCVALLGGTAFAACSPGPSRQHSRASAESFQPTPSIQRVKQMREGACGANPMGGAKPSEQEWPEQEWNLRNDPDKFNRIPIKYLEIDFGTEVKLRNFGTTTHLNGKIGTVIQTKREFPDKDKCYVRLKEDQEANSGKIKLIHKSKVRPIHFSNKEKELADTKKNLDRLKESQPTGWEDKYVELLTKQMRITHHDLEEHIKIFYSAWNTNRKYNMHPEAIPYYGMRRLTVMAYCDFLEKQLQKIKKFSMHTAKIRAKFKTSVAGLRSNSLMQLHPGGRAVVQRDVALLTGTKVTVIGRDVGKPGNVIVKDGEEREFKLPDDLLEYMPGSHSAKVKLSKPKALLKARTEVTVTGLGAGKVDVTDGDLHATRTGVEFTLRNHDRNVRPLSLMQLWRKDYILEKTSKK